MSHKDYLFVYGTLRHQAVRTAAGEQAFSQLNQAASFIDAASMSGQLFEVDGYPGVCYKSDADTHVVGDLYHVDDAATLFSTLDAYEECAAQFSAPHEYRHQRVPVILGSGETVQAWVYHYNCSTDLLPVIASGDYLQWQEAKKATVSNVKCNTHHGFVRRVAGKLLFWLLVFVVIALAGMWYLGHVDLRLLGGISNV